MPEYAAITALREAVETADEDLCWTAIGNADCVKLAKDARDSLAALEALADAATASVLTDNESWHGKWVWERRQADARLRDALARVRDGAG